MFDFDATNLAQWEAQMLKDLKGKSLEVLEWEMEEGLKINAAANQESWNEQKANKPLRRGNAFNFMDKGEWQLVQAVTSDFETPKVAKLLDEVKANQVDALLVKMEKGLNLEEMVSDYSLQYHAIHIQDSSDNLRSILSTLIQKIEEEREQTDYLTGTYAKSITAIQAQHQNGHLLQTEAKILTENATPYFSVLGIDLGEIQAKGGNLTQQLAVAIAVLVEYIETLKENGVSLEKIEAHLAFHLPTSAYFFPEIAKVRALRILIARIFEIYGFADLQNVSPYILTETTNWNKPAYDAYNNLLRTTTEAMSAILGGSNALCIRGYDAGFQVETDFSLRLARNIQHLLKHESYLDKVTDAVGGSYYVEQLTDKLAENAWTMFQTIESKGGFFAAYNWVMAEIEKTENQRKTALAKRKITLLGVNQYPNTNEVLTVSPANDANQLGSEFEALRYAIDQYSAKTGERPCAYLLQFGEVAMRNARALFSRNVIGCLGVEVYEQIVHNEIDMPKNTDFIILCSDDASYFSQGKEIIAQLKANYPNAYLILAGKPQNWEELGVNSCIFAGMNVLEYCKELAHIFE